MSSDTFEIEITRITRETARAITLHFQRTDGVTINYRPGQYMTLHVEADGWQQKRCYSFSSYAGSSDLPSVTVKEIEDGWVSKHLNQNVQVGDIFKAEGPDGRFVHTPMPHLKRRFVMIGGGSGITPLISLTEAILDTEPDATVTLYYGNRRWKDVIFRERLKGLSDHHARFQVMHILEEDQVGADAVGLMDRGFLRQHIKAPRRAIFYICGPGPMMDTAQDTLESSGALSAQMNIERFASDVPVPEDLPDTVAQVEFVKSGITVDVPPRTPILQAALKVGLPLKYRCSNGECATCMVKLLDGEVKLPEKHALTQEELDNGYVLTCCGFPGTEMVRLDA